MGKLTRKKKLRDLTKGGVEPECEAVCIILKLMPFPPRCAVLLIGLHLLNCEFPEVQSIDLGLKIKFTTF